MLPTELKMEITEYLKPDLHTCRNCRRTACDVPRSAAMVMEIDMSHDLTTSGLLRGHGDRKLVDGWDWFWPFDPAIAICGHKWWLINLPPLRESSICDVLRCVGICMEMSVWASHANYHHAITATLLHAWISGFRDIMSSYWPSTTVQLLMCYRHLLI